MVSFCQTNRAFEELVQNSQRGTSLFYFAGHGSYIPKDRIHKTSPDLPIFHTIVSFDGRLDGIYDIELRELSSKIFNKNDINLFSIIDAGWTTGTDRTIHPDYRNRFVSRDLVRQFSFDENDAKIGLFSIYPYGMDNCSRYPHIQNESELPSFENPEHKVYHGHLTHALITYFRNIDHNSALTYSDWIKDMNYFFKSIGIGEPRIIGNKDLKAKIFSNFLIEDKIVEELRTVEKHQIYDQSIHILHRLIEQRKGTYPEGHLNIGIAYAAKGQYDQGIKYLEMALAQKDNDYLEASYHLGRILYESKKEIAKAVSLLREVKTKDPNNIPVNYYLGQSIRTLIETETLAEAEMAIKTYLENGAPMGQQEELWRFLASIEEQKEVLKT
jgi:tetratricopeptide (TPR) repeat protein